MEIDAGEDLMAASVDIGQMSYAVALWQFAVSQ